MAHENQRDYESGFRRTWTRVDRAARGGAAARPVRIAADDLFAALLPDPLPESHG